MAPAICGDHRILMTFDLTTLINPLWPPVMKAYKELSLEIGRSKLLRQAGPGGTEASHAGKMRASSGTGRRRAGTHRSWMDAVSGRDFLSE